MIAHWGTISPGDFNALYPAKSDYGTDSLSGFYVLATSKIISGRYLLPPSQAFDIIRIGQGLVRTIAG